MIHYLILQRIVLIMGGTTEGKVIGKDEELFYLYISL